MALHQIGDIEALGFAYRNRQTAGSIGISTSPVATPANYASVSAIEARLTAINAAYFTAARLNQMTLNDKIFALRQADDPGTI